MLSWLSRWGRALTKGRRRKGSKGQRRDQSQELYPTLQVRMLEERRVFHGEAIIAPVENAPPPPPPPTTTVTLDASQNLLVQDASAGGTNNQLSVQLDAATARYVISDPTQTLFTDIGGAEGSGTNQIYIPVAAVTGNQLIFQTGAGNDSLAVDLSGGLGGKSLLFDGGAGEQDVLSLTGGSYSGVGYLFSADGSTQIQFGTNQLQLLGVEPIFDTLTADTRTFTIGAGVSGLRLGDDGSGGNGLSVLTTSLGTSVTFASPLSALTLAAQDGSAPATLAVSGLDSSFAGDLQINAGTSGRASLSGQINLQGGDLRVSANEIEVSGSVVTQHATLELSARSSLTVTETGLLDNAAGNVLLDAGAEGTLKFSGRIDARGLAEGETGGTVHVLGWQVEVWGTASIDVSGHSGGGTVLVGGDYQGSNPLIRNATNTFVGEGTSIHANALVSGNGGKIIVWANEVALVAGSGNLKARGGAVSGDGGLIETSGKRYLYVRDAVDASSPFGNAGTWLLDPSDVDIVDSSSQTLSEDSGPPPFKFFTSSNSRTTIAASTIAAALRGTDGTDGFNVVINTGSGNGGDGGGDITLDALLLVNLDADTTRTLTLNADDGIIIQDRINVISGHLNLVFNAGSASTDNDEIVITSAISTNGGSLTANGDSFNNTATINTDGGAVKLTITDGVTVAASISTVGGSFTVAADSFSISSGTINTGGGALSLTIDNAATIGANISTGAGTAAIDAGSIAFTGGTLNAKVATLSADGAITRSGTAASDIVISGTGAAMTLSGTALGGSAAALRLNAGTGDVNLTATSGGIAAAFTGGDFSTSQLKTLSAAGDGVTIALGTTAGNLLVNEVSAPQFNANTANDHFELSSSGDITLSDDAPLNALTIVLSAGDDILATSAGPHLKTSATTGTAITLLAGGTIGESGTDKSIGVQAGAGLVTATTSSSDTSDGVYIASSGPLHLGAVSTGNAASGTTGIQTIRITTTALPPTTPPAAPPPAPTLTISAASTTNDNWTLDSAGDIVFGDAGSLTANSATLTAVGAITGSTTDAADITTSGGDIRLTANSLGTSTAPLQLYAGSGDYILTARTGGLYMQVSTGNLLLSQLVLDVQAANQVLSLSTKNGDVVFNDLSGLTNSGTTRTDDDDWQVTAGGTSGGTPSDITFTSADPLASRNLTLNAAGNIGASGAAFLMQPTGQIDATAGGNLYLQKATGNLALSEFTNITSNATGGTANIGTVSGDVTIDNVNGIHLSDDRLEIVAGGTGNIDFDVKLTANHVDLNAGGNIISATGSGLDIDAAGGITLTAKGIGGDGSPTAISDRLEVDPHSAALSASTTGAGADGNNYLQSSSALTLSNFTTDAATTQRVDLKTTGGDLTISTAITSNDDWVLDASGDIVFTDSGTDRGSLNVNSANLTAGGTIDGSGGGTDITTVGDITLTGASIGVGQAVQVQPGAALSATATTGGVALTLAAGDFFTSQLTLSVATANQTIALTAADGRFIFDGVGSFTGTGDDDFVIATLGDNKNIEFSGAFTLLADDVSLSASGSIISGAATTDLDTTGDITLIAGGNIGASGNEFRFAQPDEASDTISVTAGGDIYLRQATGDLPTSSITTLTSTKTGGGTVVIGTIDGAVNVNGTTGWSLADDTLQIITAGTAKSITLNTTLSAGAVQLTATGAIEGNSGSATDIDTSVASGNADGSITLSGTSIGAANAIQIKPGDGAVSATATTGGVALVLEGGDFLASKLTLDVQSANQTIALAAANGRFVFDDLTNFTNTDTDDFIIAAQGNIDFEGNTTLVARNVSLTAGGNITSGDATADLNNTGTITLVSGSGRSSVGDIGASGNEFRYEPAGNVSATASGDIYLRQVGGDLFTSSFTKLESTKADGFVSIGTVAGDAGIPAGDVSINNVAGLNVADDWLEVDAGGDIVFVTTLTAKKLTLKAGGDILASGLDLNAVATSGGIDLTAGGGIGTNTRLSVQAAGMGVVTATTSGTGSDGSIYLRSVGSLNLGAITTVADAANPQTVDIVVDGASLQISRAISSDDNWFLESIGGNISFDVDGRLTARSATLTATSGQINGNTAGMTDIDTSAFNGAITLQAQSIGAGERLQLNSGTGLLDFTATLGGVFATYEGGELRTSRVKLNVGTDFQTISLSSSSGRIVFDSVAGFNLNTQNDDFEIETQGTNTNIDFTGATTLLARNVSLTATGSITSGAAEADLNTTGTITLESGAGDGTGNIGADGNAFRYQSTGTVEATADGDIYLRQVGGDLFTSTITTLISTKAGGGVVVIGTTDGAVNVDGTTGWDLSDDSLEIVTLGMDKNITLGASLSAANLRLNSTGAILSTNPDAVLNATGNIALIAVGSIGNVITVDPPTDPPTPPTIVPIRVSAGGLVTAATTADNGNIYITSTGTLNLGSFTTNANTTQTVFLESTRGGFDIRDPSFTNDDWELDANNGDIAFTDDGRLSANSIDLFASGDITSTTTGVNLDATGLIKLDAASIGALGSSLKLGPGSPLSSVSVTARSGDAHLEIQGGDFLFRKFVLLDLQDGGTFELNVRDGSLGIDQTLNTNGKNYNYDLSAAGNIEFVENGSLIGLSADLQATNIFNFSSDPTANINTSNGPIKLHATNNLGLSGAPLRVQPGTGLLTLTADTGDIFVEVLNGNIAAGKLLVSTGGINRQVSLATPNGSFNLDPRAFALNTADDRLAITAGGDITFLGTITSVGLKLTAGHSIVSAGGTSTDAIVTGSGGLLDMTASTGNIGETGGNPLTFTAAHLKTVSGGDQFLAVAPTPDSDSTRIESATGNNISLEEGKFYLLDTLTARATLTIAEGVTFGGGIQPGGQAKVTANLVQVNGTLSPGFFEASTDGTTPGDADMLTIDGNVTVAATGALVFDINFPYQVPGVDFDQLVVMGTLTLLQPELILRGATDLQTSISGVSLITTTSPVQGMFEITGSLSQDGDKVKVKVGNFSGDLILNGPQGPGIVLGELSLVPPLQRTNIRPPAIRLPVFTTVLRPLPPNPPPPPPTPPSPPPPLEFETEKIARRVLVVRIVVPIDEAGNVREDYAMTLPVEMLTDLPALLRRLPDDRYRIYLILEGSAEERLVIDVLVRDGRPMEPTTDAAGDAAPLQMPIAPPPDNHDPSGNGGNGANGPAALPDLPAAAPSAPVAPAPNQGAWNDDARSAPAGGRLFAGVGLAAAAVVAGRATAKWREQVDEAAEQIGQSRRPLWRWWRKGAAANTSSHN